MLMAVFSKHEAALFVLLYYNVNLNTVVCQEEFFCHIYQHLFAILLLTILILT